MTHETATGPGWKSITTPFTVDLYAVAGSAEGAVAVGGGGTVATERADGWEVAVGDGPAGKNRTLQSVAVTEDGRRVWFAGASGAIGCYDLDRERTYDYSYSKDISASWMAISVTGRAGEESVVAANSSGTLLPFAVTGLQPEYGAPVTPGSGAAVTALVHAPDGVCYAADTAGTVYEAGADGWQAVGVERAAATLRDLAVDPAGRVYAVSGDGVLYRRDAETWTAIEVPASSLRAVDVHADHVAVLGDARRVYRRPLDGRDRWREEALPTENDLLDLALGSPDVAVGKSGTVVERPTDEDRVDAPATEGSPAAPRPTDARVDVCDLLVSELVTRLDRAELTALIRRREGCDGALVEHLDATVAAETGRRGREGVASDPATVALPVALASEVCGETCTGNCACACGSGGSKRARTALERLLCDP